MTDVRRPRPADAAAVAELYNAYDRAFGLESDESADEIRDWWRELDLARDAWLVERNAVVAAFGCAEAPRAGVATVDACADWGLPERERVLSSLLTRAEERSVKREAARVETTIAEGDSSGSRVLAGRGYEPARRYERMRIDLATPPPPPEWPAGLRPSPFDPARDAAAFHAALDEAFADEWAYRPEPLARWRELRLAGPAFDPSLWLAVRDGDEIVATLVCEPRRFGQPWVALLGVRRPWRGRGLGLALLRHAFAEFWRRGERSVALGVDTAGPTRARALYERAGMHVDAAWVFHAKDVGDCAGGAG